MQNSKISHTLQLENSLFRYCRSNATGTVFITSENNISCQIVLKKGEIKAISFGDKRGFEAILELKDANILKFYFIQDMQFPLSIYSDIVSSDASLFHLGYCVDDISNSHIYAESQETLKLVG